MSARGRSSLARPTAPDSCSEPGFRSASRREGIIASAWAKEAVMSDDHAKLAHDDRIYTCPMHPQVRQKGPGNCPICGMALEPVAVTADEGPDPELVDLKIGRASCRERVQVSVGAVPAV